MELHADEPRMVGDLDDLRQLAVGRHAGEQQADLLQPLLVINIHLVAVAVALLDVRRTVYLSHAAAGPEQSVIGAEPHRAAEIRSEERRVGKEGRAWGSME